MADGKPYEAFVKRLQQALLDSENFSVQRNITIETNKKIIDNLGIEREFDLYWEYELGGVTYKTVIECKDYASRISLEKIDALIGKIADIPDLKPIFATKTGYQRGAEIKARKKRVELLIVREQRDDDWEDKDGTSLIREIAINMQFLPCPRIINFRPVIDGRWAQENTTLDTSVGFTLSELNTEIFIDNIAGNERYSLYDLAHRLDLKSADNYGELSYRENLQDAYIISNGLRLKITSYEVDYYRRPSFSNAMNIDFSKELIGVIEYLGKGSSTAFFTDSIIRNWK